MLERLLIVGLGSIGTRHVRLARELMPKAQIVVLRRQHWQDTDQLGIDHCVTSVAEALQFSPQAAVIANPATHHLEMALALANAGVHLLIEKPISNTAQGVSELIQICRDRNIVLLTGYNLRYFPSLQRFHELLKERRVGGTLSVRAEIGQYLPSWRPATDYRKAVSANAALGGGVLLELSHEIDYLRWLFGEVEWVSAILRKQSNLDIDVEDTAHLTLGFARQQNETPVVASLNMDFVRHDSVRTCMVIGETGTLRWNAIDGTVEIFEQGGELWQTLYAQKNKRDDSYVAEWTHFLESIEASTRTQMSGEDSLAVLRIIEAASHSSATNAVVPVKRDDRDQK